MDQTSLIYQRLNRDSANIATGNSINNINNTCVNNQISNADEIFQILSQKIAKYCQILSDLTNCEVFFKSNLNNRSLYWGTYKMMFNYSHQGLQHDKNDSLIKISGRSLTNDIANIVEELINVDNFDKNNQIRSLNSIEQKVTENNNNINNNNNGVKLKDCIVFMDRLDDQLYDHYLEKFEKSRVFTDNDDDDDDCDDQSIDDINLNQENALNNQRENMHICEICNLNAYKHAPQLKFHILKEHENIPFPDTAPFNCIKCNFNFNTNSEFLKHVLLCYYPNIYNCKICQQELNSYSDYQFHTKYVHTSVYACTSCERRFKTSQELSDHDQLIHSKTSNYCEICYESLKSRKELQQHYTDKHLINELNNNNNAKTPLIRSAKQSNNTESSNSLHDSKLNFTTDQSIISVSLDNESENSNNNNNNNNNDGTEKNEDDDGDDDDNAGTDEFYVANNKAETKMQKNELIRGLLDRKHQCKWCAQRFYTKSQLRQHESTHSNAVLFCPVCDKEFTHKDRLAGHMKCHMEPSLECKICGKKFKRLCNLYNHELVHGLTEHAFMLCQFCGRGFRSRRDYQNHVIANHRDQLMKSEIIKNNNGILNESFNASSSSLLEDEVRNNPTNSNTSKSLNTSVNSENFSNITPLKNRNNNDNSFPHNFIEEASDNRDIKKSKTYDKQNINNTQLLVKAAEFVDNNNGNSSSSSKNHNL